MKKNEKNYNIGLDIGTNSVGWSLTDLEGKLIKVNSKRHMWGVRLFDEAKPAVERRVFRSNARRKARRKERIRLLQELLKDEFKDVNENFYDTLRLSKFHTGDCYKDKHKQIKRVEKYNIFNEEKFSDKDYYKEYKTIYHLRDKLVKSSDKEDIRLVYLALHHMLKYRGNFLYPGAFSITNVDIIICKLKQVLNFVCGEDGYTDEDITNLLEILKIQNMYKKEKQEKLLNIISCDSDVRKALKVVYGLIIGKSENLSTIFNLDSEKKIKLTDDYDESEISSLLGEDFETFLVLKEISSWHTLQHILKGTTYISEAFIKKYDKYKTDLELLKKVYKEKLPDRFYFMFKDKNEKSINYYNYDNKIIKWDDFKKGVVSDFKDTDKDEDINFILNELENENFLVRLNTTDNGAIPYQLHKLELEKILENQSKYYPSIAENKDKILNIISFRIPYYVGPLHNDLNQPNNWSIRNEGMENVKVYPWNFDDVINKEASANEFIRRMTNKCTYLPEEDVIPKHSLLYSEYCVYNELNNIRYYKDKNISNDIHSDKHFILSNDEKKLIIEKLFKVTKTITKSKLKLFLEKENQFKIAEITGFQKEDEFASSLTSYIDFKKRIGLDVDLNNDMIEQIIEWVTVFEDKDILLEKLKTNFKDILNQEQIKEISKLKYPGWSRLSKKLLVEVKHTNSYGKRFSIMDLLKTTEYNFMQIITDKELGFDKIIEESQKKIESSKINYKFYEDNISSLAGSPALKRGIWQTIKVVDEIVEVMGKNPTNIFVEFARSDEDKKRTNSRRNKLKKVYDAFCNEYKDIKETKIKEVLNNTKIDITDRIYLYITQNGKCMYSGKPLEFDNLELYQVDHIIPQSKIKNDSLDNKVLVLSNENQRKLNGFLESKIINEMQPIWNKLYKSGLISQIKYFNLINNEETDKRIEGFIKRQLVETRQITKNVTNILQNLYENTDVYAIKAKLIHDFRDKYDIYKIRELNNYHHAHDAYISIVIGTYINKRYPKLLKEFRYKDYIESYKKVTAYSDKDNNRDKYGFIVSNMGKEFIDKSVGELVISKQEAEGFINNVLKQFDVLDMYITKKLEEKTGPFYNQTINSKEKVLKMKNPLRLKEDLDPLKYGAYTSENSAYYVLFKYEVKSKEEYRITGIPVKESIRIGNDLNKLKEYIKEVFGCDNVVILKNKILTNQPIYKAGLPYTIVSNNEIKIYKELRLNKQNQLLIYILLSNNNVKMSLYFKAYNILKNKFNYNIDYSGFITEFEEYISNKVKIEKSNEDKKKYLEEKKGFIEVIKEYSSEILYDVLVDKIKNEYYSGIGKSLDSYKENFMKLELKDKIDSIKILLRLTSGEPVDFKLIGGKSGQGRLCGKNMNYDWLKDVRFIEQSVTGIYKKEYMLNELENCNNIK